MTTKRSRRRTTINHKDILEFIDGLDDESPKFSQVPREQLKDSPLETDEDLIRSFCKVSFHKIKFYTPLRFYLA